MALKPMFYTEAVRQIQRAPRPVFVQLTAEFRVPKGKFSPWKVVNFDQEKDFVKGFMETSFLEVLMVLEQYRQYVYPHRNDLKVDLKRIVVGELQGGIIKSLPPTLRTYRAVLLENTDPGLLGQNSMSGLAQVSGTQTFVNVKFQLIPIEFDKLQYVRFGGPYVNSTPGDLLKCLLTQAISQTKGLENERLKGLEFVTPDNKTVRKQINIQHGVELYNLPGYLQKHGGGIYNNDIGIFSHRQLLYVYPLYDTTRYNKSKYAVDFYIIPRNQVITERTYDVKNDRVTVVITGAVKHFDFSDQKQTSEGNGAMFSVATKQFNEFVKVENGIGVLQPDKTAATVQVQERESKLNNAPMLQRRVTDNIARELSKLSARKGQLAHFVWNDADPELLVPGMPMRIFYQGPQGLVEGYGTVLGVEAYTALERPGFTTETYQTTASVMVYFIPKT
jgi:hypothetical protein